MGMIRFAKRNFTWLVVVMTYQTTAGLRRGISVVAICIFLASCSFEGRDDHDVKIEKRKIHKASGESGAPMIPLENLKDPVAIHFVSLSEMNGLILSITMRGDSDGETILSIKQCCGVEPSFTHINDVLVTSRGRSLPSKETKAGWRVMHQPGALMTVTYRLSPTGPGTIDTGVPDQVRPLIHDGYFHLIGSSALLLPIGRKASESIDLELSSSDAVQAHGFVSSFGPGGPVERFNATRSQVEKSIYLGGKISLIFHDTGHGMIGIAYSGLNQRIRTNVLREDVLAIIDAERRFFDDQQRWYLVSIHGGQARDPKVILGGGVGLMNSFAMFVNADIDLSNSEHREQFRWVLAHEYFHNWNGLALRVASDGRSNRDDASIYWFSEGFTEFYAMRILTRAGLQSSTRSLDVLNDKLRRYAANKRKDLSAKKAGALFWSDVDGEQIPYLRGYLAAWLVEIGSTQRHGNPPAN